MGYNSPEELRDYQKTYNQVKKCPVCGSRNISKWQDKDFIGDLTVGVECQECGKKANLQVGFFPGSWG